MYSGNPILIKPTHDEIILLSAATFKPGYVPSDIITCEYELLQCRTPVISELANAWIEISCMTNDATILYTLDGSSPLDGKGIRYSESFQMLQEEETVTIRAVAMKDGLGDSDEALLIVDTEQVSKPRIVRVADTVELLTATEGAKVFYDIKFLNWKQDPKDFIHSSTDQMEAYDGRYAC